MAAEVKAIKGLVDGFGRGPTSRKMAPALVQQLVPLPSDQGCWRLQQTDLYPLVPSANPPPPPPLGPSPHPCLHNAKSSNSYRNNGGVV